MNDNTFPVLVPVMVTSAAQLAAVYALLGGASTGTIAAATTKPAPAPTPAPAAVTGDAGAAPAPGPVETGSASVPAGEVDAAGWPWDESLHASTKSKTKEGLWRMKVGVSRPDPKPGFPKDASAGATGTSTGTGTPSATSPAATGTAPAPTATSGDDEDEFAAFRNALEKDKAADAGAAASVPARKWTDADLGALCNQAAVKLGDPAPVKALIAKHVPDGTVPHSRNIPEASRAAFAKEVETTAGIEFAG